MTSIQMQQLVQVQGDWIMKMGSWKHWAVGSVAALTVMAGGLWAADSAYAAEPVTATVESAKAQTFQTVGFGPGRSERGFGRPGETQARDQTLLAEALGVSVEQLEAAQDTAQARARDEALAEAVTNGDMTQAQADAVKELDGLWGGRATGRSRFGGDRGLGIRMNDHDAYLAEALGISVEQLEAAKDTAMQNGIAQAVAEGAITQEQADEMTTRLALEEYLASEMDSALASALERAVADGAITQEQAEQVQEAQQRFGGRGMKGHFAGGIQGGARDGMRSEFPGDMKGGAHGGMRGGIPGGMRGGFAAPDTQSFNGENITPGSTL